MNHRRKLRTADFYRQFEKHGYQPEKLFIQEIRTDGYELNITLVKIKPEHIDCFEIDLTRHKEHEIFPVVVRVKDIPVITKFEEYYDNET
jgi:hypothetical protein